MKLKEKPNDQARPLKSELTANRVYFALSFAPPVVIMGTIFALNRVYPFGDKQILIHDFKHQYYPFFSGFWHKFREGTLAPWSWSAGAGHDYVAFFAYYLSSPLNLLTLVMPHAALREVLTVTLLIKIGCAGLFTAMYLRYAYKECSMALPAFSSFYALCAFTLGYYHNIIWFDSFALLPLVLTGLFALMNEGKFRLYIVSLFLAIFTNFYMGFIICIFAVITFLSQCIIQKLSLKDSLRKLLCFAACSALAAGLTAVLTVPAWFALSNDYVPASILSRYSKFFNALGNFIAFTPPTRNEGLPNLYCGLICVMLAGLFFQSKKIAIRERIVLAGMFVFLIISLNVSPLYLMMHGFRWPVGFPARFSFLIAFVLVGIAYRAFLSVENKDKRGLLATGISAVLFLLSAVFGQQENKYVIGSAILCAVYILLLYLLMYLKHPKPRASVKVMFFLLILAELSITSYIGIKTPELSDTNRDDYPYQYKEIQELLSMRQKAAVDFYRTDTDTLYYHNEPYLYGYNGVTLFESTVNPNVMRFMQGLGLYGSRVKNKSYIYTDTSPLTNAFLNMRYMISRFGNNVDKNVYWETVGKAGDALLLENKYYLPLGFMVDKKLAEYKRHDSPFISQNNFFRMATGLSGNLFSMYDITNMGQKRPWMTIWNYQAPVSGMMYAYCMIGKPRINMGMTFYTEGAGLQRERSLPMTDNAPYIFSVGSMEPGDTVSFMLDNDEASLYVGHLNSELFEQGFNLLAKAPLNLTKFTNTQVCGNVTALKDGLLWTSIPGKNWNVYVDGKKSTVVLIDNAMAAVSLTKGYHEIEFKYFNKSFLVGIIVSMVSLGAFVMLIALKKKGCPKAAL